MDTLFRFLFEESYHVNAIVVRAKSFHGAINLLCDILDDFALQYVQVISKIN